MDYLDEEKENKPTGVLQKHPIIIFILAVLPILLIFSGFLLSAGQIETNNESKLTIVQMSYIQIVYSFIVLIIPAFVLSRLYKYNSIQFLGFRKKLNIKLLLLSICLFLFSNFFLNYFIDFAQLIPLPEKLATIFERLHESATNTQNSFLNYSNLPEFFLVFIVMAILPAIAEEIYFRGLIEGVLIDLKLSLFHAVLISSLLFSLVHGQFYYFFAQMFMGAILGYVYYRTRNIWYGIIMHFINNGLIVIVSYTNSKTLTNIDVDGNPPIYLSLIGLVLFGVVLYLFHQQTKPIKK